MKEILEQITVVLSELATQSNAYSLSLAKEQQRLVDLVNKFEESDINENR